MAGTGGRCAWPSSAVAAGSVPWSVAPRLDSSRWACSMAQSRPFDVRSAFDACNCKALAKPQPGCWVDAHCHERVEDVNSDGAGIANNDRDPPRGNAG